MSSPASARLDAMEREATNRPVRIHDEPIATNKLAPQEAPRVDRDVLAELRAELAAVRGRVVALEQRHGVRDAQEAAVLLAIAAAVGDRCFTSVELLRHAAVDAALGAALIEADVENARELGKLLHRLSWSRLDTYALTRAGNARAGAVWRVQVSESQTRTAAELDT